jgi:L-alanine-DL-glutamate epimerase-like enolase superfamily enzyme
MKVTIKKIELPLKVLWKISRNATQVKQNFIIEVNHKGAIGLGEIAPNIRYGETPENILSEFSKLDFTQVQSLDEALKVLKPQLLHSLRFGLESALIHWHCNVNSMTVCEYFHLQPIEVIPTSFSIPIMEISEIQSYLKDLTRFQSLKLKVNSEMALDLTLEVAKHSKQKIRIDGNEAWNDLDLFMNYYEKIKHLPIEFFEQPFPAHKKDEYKKLKKIIGHEVMADESIEDIADFSELNLMFHSINIKLMKTGGYLKALELLKEAKKYKMKSMIGCMIETSLGISSAMNLASLSEYFDLDGSLLLKNDPYDFISETNGLLKKKNN